VDRYIAAVAEFSPIEGVLYAVFEGDVVGHDSD
jgi:hypothetical protein